VEWLRQGLRKMALWKLDRRALELPGDLKNIENTAILWPSQPDEAAERMAITLAKALGKRLKAIIGYPENCSIEGVEYRRIEDKAVGFFGYPKTGAVNAVADFSSTIDLSPAFELRLSALPVMAGVPLRIGRDSAEAGSFYNIILKGNSGAEIETIIGATESKSNG